MTRPVRTAALAILLAGCAAGPRAAVHPAPGPLAWLDRLYFGRSVEGRDSVSDADWERFLRETVVPRFPDGFNLLQSRLLHFIWLNGYGFSQRIDFIRSRQLYNVFS